MLAPVLAKIESTNTEAAKRCTDVLLVHVLQIAQMPICNKEHGAFVNDEEPSTRSVFHCGAIAGRPFSNDVPR